MRKLFKAIAGGVMILALATACKSQQATLSETYAGYAGSLLDSTFRYYQVKGTHLFNENYPKKEGEMVTYLAGTDTVRKDKVAYLWPTSGLFSAVNALLKATGDARYADLLAKEILPGLRCYYDTTRLPACYQSYLAESGHSDRFYDDNIWLGIDYLESYELTRRPEYLAEAEGIWKFIESGRDTVLGDGVYWCEQKKESKNTCSNAPASVLALKLYAATKDKAYLKAGEQLYQWTRKHLQDPSDHLYWDNISLKGDRIGKAKFAYNSGQMMQAAALLYGATGDKAYLEDAKQLAAACDGYFFEDFTPANGERFRALKNGNVWFTAIMMRGYEELYKIDHNPAYMDNFGKTLQYMWTHGRSANGLFADDSFARPAEHPKASKWLLTQGAVAEMYARMAIVDKESNQKK